MTGTQLWSAFLAAGVADAQLRSLGEDIGYKRDNASAAGQAALGKLAQACQVEGAPVATGPLFAALKQHMPSIFSRKSLLEGLAADYDKRLAFASIRSATRDYLAKVAGTLPAAAPKPAQPVAQKPAPAPSPKPATVAAPAGQARPPQKAPSGSFFKEAAPPAPAVASPAAALAAANQKAQAALKKETAKQRRPEAEKPRPDPASAPPSPTSPWPIVLGAGAVLGLAILILGRSRPARTVTA